MNFYTAVLLKSDNGNTSDSPRFHIQITRFLNKNMTGIKNNKQHNRQTEINDTNNNSSHLMNKIFHMH